MFNIIRDKLPSSIYVGDGVFADINTDFRCCLKFDEIMFGIEADPKRSSKDKVIETFIIFGVESYVTSDNASLVMDGILSFYRCFKPKRKLNKKVEQKMKGIKQPKYFDFTYDAPYIYAAFMQEYKIDLSEAKMHWFKFKALFDALSADTQFAKIISYRGTDISQIKDEKEKARITRLQFLYALPRNLTEEEKVAEFGKAFHRVEGKPK